MHMDGGRVPDGRGINNFILENCKNEYYRKLMLKDRGDMEQITNNENIYKKLYPWGQFYFVVSTGVPEHLYDYQSATTNLGLNEFNVRRRKNKLLGYPSQIIVETDYGSCMWIIPERRFKLEINIKIQDTVRNLIKKKIIAKQHSWNVVVHHFLRELNNDVLSEIQTLMGVK